jgi:signal transduction histidine kinase/CheY-like chemotaxis protein
MGKKLKSMNLRFFSGPVFDLSSPSGDENPMFQKIPPSQQDAYRDFRYLHMQHFMRVGIFLGIIVFSFFGILDFMLLPEEYLLAWLIRLTLYPVFLAFFWDINFRKGKKHYYEFYSSALVVAGGWSLITIMALFQSENPEIEKYYFGILLIFIWGTILFRKTPPALTVISLLVFVPLEYLLFNNLPGGDYGAGHFVTAQFYILGTLFLLFITSYVLEFFLRDIFLNSQKLMIAEKKAVQAGKAKTRFLANMSHEIRTPINEIIGISEILKDSDLTDRQHELLQIMKESAHGLIHIINDILDLSKVEAGKLNFEDNHFELPVLLANSLKIFELKAKGKGLRFEVNLSKELPRWVFGDPIRLKQVVINLVNNAIKFTPDGAVIVSFHLGQQIPGRFQLLFSIRDTGIGMSEEDKNQIFRPFGQVASLSFGGTGLGLVIVHSLVKMMGGDLHVESSPEQGSEFKGYIWLNRSYREKNSVVNPPNKIKTVSSSRCRYEILLVEDNPVNRRVALYQLKKLGHFVETVPNGLEAVKICKEKHFDIIFMDIQMPVMDGVQAAQRINEYQAGLPDNQKSWIIALTANAIKGDRERFLESGMQDYISKPFTPAQLDHAILQFSEHSHHSISES